jgi:hypothetical protein
MGGNSFVLDFIEEEALSDAVIDPMADPTKEIKKVFSEGVTEHKIDLSLCPECKDIIGHTKYCSRNLIDEED